MIKAKVGDYIQSLDFDREDSPFKLGKVIEIKKDPFDGVEYVHFQAEYDISGNEVIKINQLMRVPQNGTPTTLGRITNNIKVLKPKN